VIHQPRSQPLFPRKPPNRWLPPPHPNYTSLTDLAIFLDHVREKGVPVTVFLMNGIRLQGYVSGFDSYTVLLRRDTQVQVVYKHTISTIMPTEALQLNEKESAATPSRQVGVSNLRL
jgi:host factor-I protein